MVWDSISMWLLRSWLSVALCGLRTRVWSKPKISGAIWTLGIKKLKAIIFFFRATWDLVYIFYTSSIEMSQHFQGPFGPLVLTFCGLLPNFESNWLWGPPFFFFFFFWGNCKYGYVSWWTHSWMTHLQHSLWYNSAYICLFFSLIKCDPA